MLVAAADPVPALAPVEAALATVRSRRGPAGTIGLHPDLLVPPGAPGWQPAQRLLADSDQLDRLLTAARGKWDASPHVFVSLAWRSYTYWLTMPVVLGWAVARRVPLVAPADVLVQVDGAGQLLRFGLRRLRMAVLADDPLATGVAAAAGGAGPESATRTTGPARSSAAAVPPLAGAPALAVVALQSATPHRVTPELTVVDGESSLLAQLRRSLLEEHLEPLLERFQRRSRLGRRTLLGSLASAASHALVRGVDAPADQVVAAAEVLLPALGLADLVSVTAGPHGLHVRRRTCCQAFALPQPKICAGCPLPVEH